MNQLTKVISYAKGYDNISLSTYEVMCKWYENKKHIINNIFNGQLIYEFPNLIEVELSKEEKNEIFNKFITELDSDIDYFDNFDDFLLFLSDNKEGFFSNTVVNTNRTETKTKRVQKGDKLLKTFKYFINNDDNRLRYYQDLASKYIQQNKLTGHLCLSVHPLDFLTLSENNCGWRSCHALDGEYATGNFSYMLDSSTFVCYLKTNKQEQLKCFPPGMLWNSKKWRVLAHINQNHSAVWFSKQYPFSNKKLMENIWKHPYFCYNGFHKPYACGITQMVNIYNEKVLMDSQHLIYFQGKIFDIQAFIHQNPSATNFNDLLSSFQGCPAVIMNKWTIFQDFITTEDLINEFKVEIGEDFKPLCGCDKEFYSNEDFVCEKCREKAYGNVKRCECCEGIIHDELFTFVNKTTDEVISVCEECYKYLKKYEDLELMH